MVRNEQISFLGDNYASGTLFQQQKSTSINLKKIVGILANNILNAKIPTIFFHHIIGLE